MKHKIEIRTHILTNILIVVIVVAAALLGLQYHFAKQMAIEATGKTFHHLTDKITAVAQGRDRLAKEILSLIAQYPGMETPPSSTSQIELIRRLSIIMRQKKNVYAIYTGYRNGDLFEVVNLESSSHLHCFYNAPNDARWMVTKVMNTPDGKRIRRMDFYNAMFNPLTSRTEATTWRVNSRSWYTQALRSATAVRSDPYVFADLKESGITYSKKMAGGAVVLAADITLDKFEAFCKQLKSSTESEIMMFSHDGKIFASSEEGKTRVDAYLEHAAAFKTIGKILRYTRNGKKRLAMLVPLSKDAGETTMLGFSVDEATMLAPYIEKIYVGFAAAMVALLLMLPLVRFTTKRIVKPIKLLTEETYKIKERRFEAVKPIETNIIELEALSDSLVSMAQSIQTYQKDQKRLMDSIIKLIADAIDAKSPYTGGHCKRVPVIAEMLLKAANDENKGQFKLFSLEGEDAWQEFEHGAWLHDCGKIATPVYVVDKATKLETIYNRIHEIRTRFEVIWRDIEIAYYERLISGEEKSIAEAWKTKEHAVLLDDFAFIANTNVGGEFMSEEHKTRVRNIAKRTWIRHFDDRVGLSNAERLRLENISERPVPAQEQLLDDKPEHRIARTDFDEAAYRAQGFKLEVPDLLYNYGEIYNLCIEKGTISAEERFKINEHVIMSIRMLEHLPLPDNLKRIPEYAGAHHETMIGTGYPRQLIKDQLSIPARVMAIADIFEALTASDRPYKKGKTLSQALKIMSFMAKDAHIDAELFDLFLRSDIYKTYARQYLKSEQIDEVNIEALSGKT